MTENQLIANLFTIIKTGFASRSISVGMKQSYQPTQQGAPIGPVVFLHKIADNEYGYPQRIDVWNSQTEEMEHTETQNVETTFQVNATCTQIPANTTQLTAGDYVKTAARILGSDTTVVALKALGIGIYRIQKITTTRFTDERAQYEPSPSFDFTVRYQTVETTTLPSAATLAGTVSQA